MYGMKYIKKYIYTVDLILAYPTHTYTEWSHTLYTPIESTLIYDNSTFNYIKALGTSAPSDGIKLPGTSENKHASWCYLRGVIYMSLPCKGRDDLFVLGVERRRRCVTKLQRVWRIEFMFVLSALFPSLFNLPCLFMLLLFFFLFSFFLFFFSIFSFVACIPKIR